MPKMTVKYRTALVALECERLSTSGDQETIYNRLMQAGYYWDSKQGVWIQTASEPGDPASPIIRIRVWADAYKVEAVASQVCAAMTGKGYRLLEQSIAYPCRPPKQAESRIYLSFIYPSEE